MGDFGAISSLNMTRSNQMKFRLRDFCNGANLRHADLEGGEQYRSLISLRSKCFRAVSEQRTGNRSQRPCEKWDIFLVLVPFFARPKLKIPFLVVPWAFFAPSHKETLAKKAACLKNC